MDDVRDIDLSIVIPVFNNAGTLDILIDRLLQVLDETDGVAEAVFVDDGSTDSSLEILERRAARDDRIRIVPLTRNFGGQAALCAGFDRVRGKRTVCMDADLENYPEDVPALLAALDRGYDLACGVREQRQGAWLRRRLPSALLNNYVRQHVRHPVQDIGCGMRAMDSQVVDRLEEEGERRRMLSPLLLRRADRVIEVPIRHGQTELPGGHSFVSLLAIAVDFYMITGKRPFLITATASGAVAALGLALLVGGWIGQSGYAAIAGAVSATGGCLGILVSLVGQYVQRIYQLQQNLPFYEVRAHSARKSDRPKGPTVS
jgi:glycosyltransferase involved in cell wall biosynthesis